MPDILVVGAGFWGAVIAERLASAGRSVLVIDKRLHVGGNAYSRPDPLTGIEHHLYGAHIFHTANERVWEYVNRFTAFTSYRHKVLARHKGRVYPMPISLATINQFFGLDLRPGEVADFIAQQAGGSPEHAENLEDKAIALIGRPLYEAFIRGYTWKQWQVDPKTLSEAIISRLPVRHDYNTDYFNDPWQGMPAEGYGALFERLLDHPRIEVRLGVDYFDKQTPDVAHTFYSGPLDALFHCDAGRLDWRSLRFVTRVEPVADWQGTSVINESDLDVPYTRTIEYKHFHPERPAFRSSSTLISEEYSEACPGSPDAEPFYPVDTAQNRELRDRYLARADALGNLTAGGRLGRYRYLDMDKTVADALETVDRLKDRI